MDFIYSIEAPFVIRCLFVSLHPSPVKGEGILARNYGRFACEE